jgi:hypothetical protein
MDDSRLPEFGSRKSLLVLYICVIILGASLSKLLMFLYLYIEICVKPMEEGPKSIICFLSCLVTKIILKEKEKTLTYKEGKRRN